MNQKGFANIILVVVIIVLLGAVGYFAFVKKSEPVAQQPTPTPTQTKTPVSPIPTPKDETANWKTYQNESYQLLFKYPPNWSVELIENQSYPLTFEGDRQGIIIARPNQRGKEAQNYLNNIFVSYREITEPFEEYIRPEFCDVGECSPVELDLQEEVVIDGRKGVLQVGDLGIAGKEIQALIQMNGSKILAVYSIIFPATVEEPAEGLESPEAKNQIQIFRAILNSIKFLE